MISETKKYLQFIFPFFNTKRTKEIFRVNPTVMPVREEASEISIYVYDYDRDDMKEYELDKISDAFTCRDNHKISWINIDGIRKSDVEAICKHFGVHPLLVEDILSIGQRPKMDEIDNVLFCLLNMLYFNTLNGAVESEHSRCTDSHLDQPVHPRHLHRARSGRWLNWRQPAAHQADSPEPDRHADAPG